MGCMVADQKPYNTKVRLFDFVDICWVVGLLG